MKLTYRKLLEKATIISLLSRRRGQDGKTLPHVAGNLGHPMLAWRVSQALKKMGPVIEEFEGERNAFVEQCKVEVVPGPDEKRVSDEPVYELDAERFGGLLEKLLDEEVEVPDFKPLTWKTIEQARLGEETVADRAERAEGVVVMPFDASVVIALGDFLQGEPTEE
jgi:hypothetical protein